MRVHRLAAPASASLTIRELAAHVKHDARTIRDRLKGVWLGCLASAW